jgi:hypothetical protein
MRHWLCCITRLSILKTIRRKIRGRFSRKAATAVLEEGFGRGIVTLRHISQPLSDAASEAITYGEDLTINDILINQGYDATYCPTYL